MTPFQRRLVDILPPNPGISPAAAYLQASGKPGMKKRVAAACASKLLQKAAVQDALADVKHEDETRWPVDGVFRPLKGINVESERDSVGASA